ncbi:MAG: exopolyphosphatase [Methylophilaceae bacterium]|nr:exopolyphosphatase [Methylophilaceae bacterium]
MALSEIAAVDLGSNSFRLQMARVQDGQLIFHDSLRDAVRLGAGLNQDNQLDAGAQRRAIDCLKRFGERLRGLPPQAVRAVATNTFRVASNAAQLLEEAQAALGFPIEIIAGREEARMIFIGVSHGLPAARHKRLVIDIGGGSTEFIVGQGFEPESMESLFMGCVSYSLRFFSDGKITETNMRDAEIAAGAEIQSIQQHFSYDHWQEAVGSSGTARALGEILRLNDWSDGAITHDGLKQLRNQLIKAKDTKRLVLAGLSEDRAAVIPGGLAIMMAAFEVLNIERMTTVSTALREGVLYELLGRMNYHDIREATVNNFMRRYHVDIAQANRVEKLALSLLSQVDHQLTMDADTAGNHLSWAVRLHEIGISIAHNAFHKHSAYIVENADMPGFSAKDQGALGLLVRAQRRSLNKLAQLSIQDDRCLLVLILRLAILFHRNRLDSSRPQLQLTRERDEFQLKMPALWLKNNPLTAAELASEIAYWKNINLRLSIWDIL